MIEFLTKLYQTPLSFISNFFGKLILGEEGSVLIYDMGEWLTLSHDGNSYQYRNKLGNLHRISGPAIISFCEKSKVHDITSHNEFGVTEDCGEAELVQIGFYSDGEFKGSDV